MLIVTFLDEDRDVDEFKCRSITALPEHLYLVEDEFEDVVVRTDILHIINIKSILCGDV